MSNISIENFLTRVRTLIASAGEEETAYLTVEVCDSIRSFLASGDSFFEENIAGVLLSSYIDKVHQGGELLFDEDTLDASYFLWSIVDAYSDMETKELVLTSITSDETFENFKIYIQGMRHNTVE
jgi:hypothetical protein